MKWWHPWHMPMALSAGPVQHCPQGSPKHGAQGGRPNLPPTPKDGYGCTESQCKVSGLAHSPQPQPLHGSQPPSPGVHTQPQISQTSATYPYSKIPFSFLGPSQNRVHVIFREKIWYILVGRVYTAILFVQILQYYTRPGVCICYGID